MTMLNMLSSFELGLATTSIKANHSPSPSSKEDSMFSIVIPSWNNLPYLRLCVESLRKHSRFEHEIIVHLNDGSDGSLDWVKSQGIKYTQSDKNIGVCLSVNHLVAQAKHDWV